MRALIIVKRDLNALSLRPYIWLGAVLALLLVVAVALQRSERSAHQAATAGVQATPTAQAPTAGQPTIEAPTARPLVAEAPTAGPLVAEPPTAAPLVAELPTVEAPTVAVPTLEPATVQAPAGAAPTKAAPTATPPTKAPAATPHAAPASATPTRPQAGATRAAPKSRPAPPPVRGHAYYVDSVTGSDSNSGASPAAAWRSLGPVNARTFAAGDVIDLARSSTWTGSGGISAALVLKGAGVSGNPITLQAYGTGPAPVLRNPDDHNFSRILIIRAPYTLVQGLLLRDARETGLLIGQSADHSTVQNVEVTNTGFGIRVDAQWTLIINNHVHDLHMVVDASGGNVSYGAQGIVVQGPNNEVAYNRLINCSAPSHEYGRDGSAVEFFGNVDNTLVHHNYAFNTPSFNEVGGGSARNVVVAQNILVQSGQLEVIHLTGPYATTVDNFQFVNNTVYDASDAGAFSLFFISGQASGPGAFVVRNNIFSVRNYSLAMQGESPFTHDHNLYHLMNPGMDLNYALGAGERLGDPLFVDPQAGDFRLKAASPALGAGTAAQLATSIAPAVSGLALTPNLGAAQQ